MPAREVPADGAIQDVSDQPPLLRVHHLVVALLQLAEHQRVADVHRRKFLESHYLVLQGAKQFRVKGIMFMYVYTKWSKLEV